MRRRGRPTTERCNFLRRRESGQFRPPCSPERRGEIRGRRPYRSQHSRSKLPASQKSTFALIEGRSASKATDLFRPSQQVGRTPVVARTVRTTMTSAKLVEWIGNERPRLPFRFRLRRSFAGVAGQRSRSLARVLARSLRLQYRLRAGRGTFRPSRPRRPASHAQGAGVSDARRAELRPRSRIAVLILPWRGRMRFERGGGGRRSRA